MSEKDTIIRTQIIVVDVVGENSYGDLTFTDKEGTAYKIPVKRKQYFDKIIISDEAVQLNYAMSAFGKEYIYSAVQVEGKLSPPRKPYQAPVPIAKPVKPDRDLTIEAQVAIKSITELWAAGKLTEDNSLVIALKIWLSEKLNPYMMPQTTARPLTQDIKDSFAIPKPQEKEQTKIEPTIVPFTTEQLLQYCADKMNFKNPKTSYTWLVNKCKVSEQDIVSNPRGVLDEVKALMGWTD